MKRLTKFVCNGFIQSFYQSLRILNNQQQNNKNRNTNRYILGVAFFFANLRHRKKLKPE